MSLLACDAGAAEVLHAPGPATTPQASATESERDEDVEDVEPVVAELNADARPPVGPRAGAVADLVVLISVDGLRPDVIFPHARNIERMRQNGTYAANASTVAKSTTLPSHASMVSGVGPLRHGLSFNSDDPTRGHIRYPTIFTAAQAAGLTTGLFVGKRKLRHLLNPEDEAHFAVGGAFCHRVTQLALPYIETAEAGVIFLHFSDPDAAGHTHGWMSQGYSSAVGRADRCVGQVLDALERRGKLERTLVLLTADHGGHDNRHGSRLKSDKHIPWILYGGPVRPARVRRPVLTTDTAATVLYALGLPLPDDIAGKPILDGLAPAAQTETVLTAPSRK